MSFRRNNEGPGWLGLLGLLDYYTRMTAPCHTGLGNHPISFSIDITVEDLIENWLIMLLASSITMVT